MTLDSLRSLYERDLKKLIKEVELYEKEESMWLIEANILNSGGNLCLHLVGNLQTYIGVGLAKTDYVRNRDAEFSLKNVPKTKLIEQVEETIKVVARGLNNLNEADLSKDFPIIIWDKPTNMGYTLIHLLTHLSYHLGQINYHRRMIEKNPV